MLFRSFIIVSLYWYHSIVIQFDLKVLRKINLARQNHCDLLEDGSYMVKRGHDRAIRNLEKEFKHPIVQENAWLTHLPHFPLFACIPSDELHSVISGIGGDHLIPAVLYRYVITLLFKFMLFHFEFICFIIISF